MDFSHRVRLVTRRLSRRGFNSANKRVEVCLNTKYNNTAGRANGMRHSRYRKLVLYRPKFKCKSYRARSLSSCPPPSLGFRLFASHGTCSELVQALVDAKGRCSESIASWLSGNSALIHPIQTQYSNSAFQTRLWYTIRLRDSFHVDVTADVCSRRWRES